MVQAGPNPYLHLLGYLLTMVSPRKTLHIAFEETLRGLYGSQVFESRFLEAIAYAESITKRMPIQQHKPKGQPAKDIMKLADEILTRMEMASVPSRMEVAG